ncbi:MAG: glycosyltransferase [bacterium]|nr:glycosyltransferase [bacterium]
MNRSLSGKLLSGRIYPEFFNIANDDTVLYAGCGQGSQVLAYGNKGAHIVASDVQKERVESALRNAEALGIKNIEGVAANLESLPFADNTFDKIIAVDVIQHAQNPEKVFAELRRVLKENGRVLVTFPALQHYLLTKISRWKNGTSPGGKWNPDAFNHNLPVAEWLLAASDAGLELVRSHATTLFPPLHRYGIPRFWFSNEVIHAFDYFLGGLWGLKNFGQALMCVYHKVIPNKKSDMKKKIYYIANLRLPTEKAHGVQIMRMCSAFAHAGNDVTLITPFRFRVGDLGHVKNIFTYYGVEKNFKILRLPSFDLFPLTHFFPFFDRAAFVIQYGSFLLSVICYLLSMRRQKAVIYTRDSRIARLVLWLTKNVFLELHTIPKMDDIEVARGVCGIVTVTRKLRDLLIEGGVAEENIMVAPDGVDVAAFESVIKDETELRKELHLPMDAILVGYTGRLKTFDQEKGIPELLEAFAVAYATHPRIRLVIIGGDPADAQKYTKRLTDSRIIARIHFVRHVPPTDVPKYLKALDVLVAPFPRSEHYANAMSPLKIFEYMASGKPMVVSDLPSVREILSGESAYFFEAGNPQDLARVLLKVLDNPDQARQRAEGARKLVPKYIWKERAKNILDFMEIQTPASER